MGCDGRRAGQRATLSPRFGACDERCEKESSLSARKQASTHAELRGGDDRCSTTSAETRLASGGGTCCLAVVDIVEPAGESPISRLRQLDVLLPLRRHRNVRCGRSAATAAAAGSRLRHRCGPVPLFCRRRGPGRCWHPPAIPRDGSLFDVSVGRLPRVGRTDGRGRVMEAEVLTWCPPAPPWVSSVPHGGVDTPARSAAIWR